MVWLAGCGPRTEAEKTDNDCIRALQEVRLTNDPARDILMAKAGDVIDLWSVLIERKEPPGTVVADFASQLRDSSSWSDFR